MRSAVIARANAHWGTEPAQPCMIAAPAVASTGMTMTQNHQ
jgi:hypothetical protein